LRPAQANGSQDFISKITRAKQTGGVTQTVEHPEFKPWLNKQKKNQQNVLEVGHA
jgi:hypothetical protein